MNFHMQGRFEILTLSGSFLLSESSGQRSRTGGLSVSLSGPDGRVLGGGVAGLLTAASPVQVHFFQLFPNSYLCVRIFIYLFLTCDAKIISLSSEDFPQYVWVYEL